MNTRIKIICGDAAVDLAIDTVRIGKQALVFVSTKKSAEKTAEEIAKRLGVMSRGLGELSEKLRGSLERPTPQCERLANCARTGVVFHHAGLSHGQKGLIEKEFRKGTLKIICCTPTLAYGVNLPSFRTIIKSLKRYTGRWGMQWIPVLEYLQFAGRSGRPDFNDEHGEAIAVARTEDAKDKIYERYILGRPEEIYSKLAVEPVLRTYLLSLITTRVVQNRAEILDFFGQTLWAQQFGDMEELSRIIDKMLSLLEDWGFIGGFEQKSDFVSGDEIGKAKSARIHATKIGERVSQLYLDPLTAHQFIEALSASKEMQTNEFSFLHMISSALEMRPLLRARSRETNLLNDFLVSKSEYLIMEEPSVYDARYDDFLDSIKTAMVLEEWIGEKDENSIMEIYNVRPGELHSKINLADWLIYSAVEMSRIIYVPKTASFLMKLRVRLKYGARAELLPLLRIKGIGKVRARKLFNRGYKNLGDLRRADVSSLGSIVGKKIAEDVKKQLGEKVEDNSQEKLEFAVKQ